MSFLRNAWYCAGLSNEIGETPFARRLLDEPVLLYRLQNGDVAALSDMCPHRFAPLHQGKREGDLIECPYHGLQFDRTGTCVLNPHGSGAIPGSARVKAYPLVESQGVAWIWMGEGAAADPALIPDLNLFDDPGCRVQDQLHMPVDYRLLIDNLLDLTHATYLHPGTLTPGKAKREGWFGTHERGVNSRYAMIGVDTPSAQRLFFPGPRGDFRSWVDWQLPSVVLVRTSMAEEGQAPEDGALTNSAHLITPETATSLHYTWILTRNRLVPHPAVDAGILAAINKAFVDEDQPMMKMCQAYMAGRDFFSLQPLYLDTDAAAARARRMLEQAIAEEASAVTRKSAAISA